MLDFTSPQLNSPHFGARQRRTASNKHAKSIIQRNQGIKKPKLPDILKQLPPQDVEVHTEPAASIAPKSDAERRERACQDFNQLHKRATRGTLLASKEVARLQQYLGLFPADSLQTKIIKNTLSKNEVNGATQQATVLRNKQEQGTPLTEAELKQLQASLPLFPPKSPTVELIQVLLDRQPSLQAGQLMVPLQKKLATGHPLGGVERKQLEGMKPTVAEFPELQERFTALTDQDRLLYAVKFPNRIQASDLEAIEASLQRPHLSDSQRKDAQALLNGQLLQHLAETPLEPSNDTTRPQWLSLVSQLANGTFSKNQRNKARPLLEAWAQQVLLPENPTAQALQKSIQAFPPENTPEETTARNGLLEQAWAQALLKTDPTDEALLSLLPAFEANAAAQTELGSTLAERFLPKFSQKLVENNQLLNFEELKLLAALPLESLPIEQDNALKFLIDQQLYHVAERFVSKVNECLDDHAMEHLQQLPTALESYLKDSGLAAMAAQTHQTPTLEAAQNKLRLCVEPLSTFQYREDGVYIKQQPRQGPPLTEMRMATYNLQELLSDRILKEGSSPERVFSEKKRLLALKNRILETQADVLVLQECCGLDSVTQLLEETGLKSLYPNVIYALPQVRAATIAKARANGGDVCGITILAKNTVGFQPEDVALIQSSHARSSGSIRPMVEVALDTGNPTPLYLEALHLKADYMDQARGKRDCSHIRQVERSLLERRLDELYDQTVVVMGDFNEENTTLEGMDPLPPQNADIGTYQHPFRKDRLGVLDYIFVKNAAAILDGPVILTSPEEPSDHRPLVFSLDPR
jgi:endonuclease/exonuclease/phosphatase family metal-dependent hydrolase